MRKRLTKIFKLLAKICTRIFKRLTKTRKRLTTILKRATRILRRLAKIVSGARKIFSGWRKYLRSNLNCNSSNPAAEKRKKKQTDYLIAPRSPPRTLCDRLEPPRAPIPPKVAPPREAWEGVSLQRGVDFPGLATNGDRRSENRC